MKLTPLILLAAACFAWVAPASAETRRYASTLSGAAEDPPTVSPGNGSVLVTIDDVARTMRVQASFADLLAGTAAAHIHCCTAVAGAGNVGVATTTPSFVGFPLGITAGTFDNLFDMNLAGSWNAPFISAHGGTTALAFVDLLVGLDAGKAYFNVHTTRFPGGEIRGFLTPVPEPSTYALMLVGLAAVGASARRIRRR